MEAGFVPISSLTGSSTGSSPNVSLTATGGLSTQGGAVDGMVISFSLKDQSGVVRASWQHAITLLDIGHSNFSSTLDGQSLPAGSYNLYAAVTSGGSSETKGPSPVIVGSSG